MIAAIIAGQLVSLVDHGTHVTARVVADGVPVQLEGRNKARRALVALPIGSPVSLAGELTTEAKTDRKGQPYVCHTVRVSAVQSVAPPAPRRFGLGAIFNPMKAKA